jgi:hypothetical protein
MPGRVKKKYNVLLELFITYDGLTSDDQE